MSGGNDRDGVDGVSGADERFVEFLRREAAGYHRPPGTPREGMWPGIEAAWRTASLAAGYHEPPETPREEMWPRIEAAWRLRTSAAEGSRDAGREDAEILPGGRPAARAAGEAPPRRRRGALWGWAAGMAAALLVGVAIGRGVLDFGGDASGPGLAAGDRPAAESPETGARTAGERAGERMGERTGERVGERGVRPPGEPAAGTGGGEPAGTAPSLGDGGLPYRLATAEHLGRVESLLASFRDEGGLAENDRRVAAWAGELLAETRLLLDWPTERDPRMRALLEELELVLAQMARLDQGEAAAERGWIVEGLERRDVLPRVRAAVPAGMLVSNDQGV